MTTIWNEMNMQFALCAWQSHRNSDSWYGLIYCLSYFRSSVCCTVGLAHWSLVLIPYIGATVVTPCISGLLPMGLLLEFLWLVVVYGIIQLLDGNVLVPLLFSEVVNLHPVAIIIAVLLFGGIWGFWGLFFAIPLATLVKAVYNAWPSNPAK